MISVDQKIPVCEIDGIPVELPEDGFINLQSHWNSPRMVILKIWNRTYTVLGEDLIAAVKNAGNTNRF